MSAALTPSDLAAALRFYADAGVDLGLEEAAIDRFAEEEARRKQALADAQNMATTPSQGKVGPAQGAQGSQGAQGAQGTAQPRPVAIPPLDFASSQDADAPLGASEAVASARKLLDGVDTLDGLRAALASFKGMAITETATNMVFADGNPEADLMLIGEAPGSQEDRQGIPFCGESGQLLDRMLAAIGIERASDCYITNIVNFRPPGNRNPTSAEIATSMPFVERHIALVKPKVIVALGGVPAKALTDRPEGIMKLRGRWFDYGATSDERSLQAAPVPLLATFHPAFLLRQPARKREAWRDLLALKRKLAADS